MSTPRGTTLARRIKGRRQDLGLTATDLANLCDVTLQAVLKWESGETENLKHEHLFLLADALNVRPRWLAMGEGEKLALPAQDAYSEALAHRDQTDSPKARGVWERIAATFAKAATVVVMAVPPLMVPNDANATLHNVILRPQLNYNTHWLSIRRWLRNNVQLFARVVGVGQLAAAPASAC